MRLLSSSVALFLSLAVASASVTHNNIDVAARHHKLAHRAASNPLQLRAPTEKKCRNRVNPNKPSSTAVSSATPTTSKSVAPPKPTPTTTSTKKAAPTPAPAPPPAPPVSAGGLINVWSPQCGASGATKAITALSGPNGHLNWLNCGFETAGGWDPPHVKMSDIITQSLHTALQSPSSPFKACAPYIPIFERYGNEFGIPAIMLASFAMQESSCRADTTGGAGEQGLMQITREKCGGAPGGNCKDPDFNIRTAARFFKDTVSANGGNVLLSIGAYNGFRRGLTKTQAFAAAHTGCCRCQNNGDYMHQFLNGWCQNIDAYAHNPRLGKYFNLDKCGH